MSRTIARSDIMCFTALMTTNDCLEQTRYHMSMCFAALMTTNDCLEQAGYQFQSDIINMWYNSSFWAKF